MEPDRRRQRGDRRRHPGAVLEEDLTVEGGPLRTRLADVGLDGPALPVARDEEVGQRDGQDVAVGMTPGDRRVSRPIDELVVVQVVRRDPGEGGITVEER